MIYSKDESQFHSMIDDLENKINDVKKIRQAIIQQRLPILNNTYQSPHQSIHLEARSPQLNLYNQQLHSPKQTIHQPSLSLQHQQRSPQSIHRQSDHSNNLPININNTEFIRLKATVQLQNQQIQNLHQQFKNTNIEIQGLKEQVGSLKTSLDSRIKMEKNRSNHSQQLRDVENKKADIDMFQELQNRFNEQLSQMKNYMDQSIIGILNMSMRQGSNQFNRSTNWQPNPEIMKTFENDSFFNRNSQQWNSNNSPQQQWDNNQQWNSNNNQQLNSQQFQHDDNAQNRPNNSQQDDYHHTQIINSNNPNTNISQQKIEIENDQNELIDDYDKQHQNVSDITRSQNQRKDFIQSLDRNNILDLSQVKKGLKVYQILQECKQKKKRYLDGQFDANIDSISTDQHSKEYQTFKNCKWLRPQQIFNNGKPIRVFDNISIHDIKQGQLGVCYLLATLSSLAEYPNILKRLFNIHEYNKYGCYSVNIFVQGKKQEIIVDDLFPCFHNEPVFSRPEGNELWVLILEKAWCKLYGEYTIAQGGFPNVSQEHLTGAPGLMYSDVNQPEYWEDEQKMADLLMDWESNKYLMGTGTKGQGEIQNEQGLISGHAYTILGVYKWKRDYIVQLRNPWGYKEFKGKYDEQNHYVWQDEQLRQLVGYQNSDDGIFYMTIPELQQNMDILSCCKEKFSYQVHQTFDINIKSNEYVYFRFELSRREEINFRIHQKMQQMLNDPDYECSPVIFNIYKVDDADEIELISDGDLFRRWGNYSINHCDEHFSDLEDGKYLIEVSVCWNKYRYPLVLNYYSRNHVGVEQVDSIAGIKQCQNLIYSYYQQYAISIANDNPEFIKVTKYYDDSIFLIYFKNKNQSFKLALSFEIEDDEHYFDTPDGARLSMEVQLKAGDYLFAIVRPIDYYSKNSLQMKSQTKFI